MIYWKIDKRLDCDSDHLPIALTIDWSWQSSVPTKKQLWTKTNPTILQQTVKECLPRTYNTTVLEDEESIDRFVASIIKALDTGIEASTL